MCSSDLIRRQLQEVPPFRVELGDVEVFADTQAIYVAIRDGHDELKRLHGMLNSGGVRFQEAYPYHPHVTVAQELAPEDVPAAAQFARWRWSEYAHDRHFVVDQLTFVRNTTEGFWTDLDSVSLTSPVAF